MYYYKTLIQYDGTNFAGFQWQKKIPTIQNDFNNALKTLIDCKFTTMSASRTDTGVHAMEQIVKISSVNPIECFSFLESFNKSLSSQIRCITFEVCDALFRPSAESLSKEYRYFFTNKRQVSIDESRFISNISNNLDFKIIETCIKELLGEHNFCNFYSSGSNVKTTTRNILSCELTEINPHSILSKSDIFPIPEHLNNCYQIKIEANGFLKQMIRHIVSALWMVGSGKLSIQEFMKLLNGPKSLKQIWKVAPPNGLFLYQIDYPNSKSETKNTQLFTE